MQKLKGLEIEAGGKCWLLLIKSWETIEIMRVLW